MRGNSLSSPLAENVGEMACSNCLLCANPWTKLCSNIIKTWHVLLWVNIVLEITDAVLERKTIDDIKDKIAAYQGSNITEWCNESHAMNSINSIMSVYCHYDGNKWGLELWSMVAYVLSYGCLIEVFVFLIKYELQSRISQQAGSHPQNRNNNYIESLAAETELDQLQDYDKQEDSNTTAETRSSMSEKSTQTSQYNLTSPNEPKGKVGILFQRLISVAILVNLLVERIFVLLICIGQLNFAHKSHFTLCIYTQSALNSAQTALLVVTSLFALFLSCLHIQTLFLEKETHCEVSRRGGASSWCHVLTYVLSFIDLFLSSAAVAAAVITAAVAYGYHFIIISYCLVKVIFTWCSVPLVVTDIVCAEQRVASSVGPL